MSSFSKWTSLHSQHEQLGELVNKNTDILVHESMETIQLPVMLWSIRYLTFHSYDLNFLVLQSLPHSFVYAKELFGLPIRLPVCALCLFT